MRVETTTKIFRYRMQHTSDEETIYITEAEACEIASEMALHRGKPMDGEPDPYGHLSFKAYAEKALELIVGNHTKAMGLDVLVDDMIDEDMGGGLMIDFEWHPKSSSS